MNIIRIITALIMAVILPLMNLTAADKDRKEGTYSEMPAIEKQKRTFCEFEPGENDIEVYPEESPAQIIEIIKEKRNSGNSDIITVYLHEGNYNTGEVLDLTGLKNVSFSACPGERVSFSSGAVFDEWREETVNGVKAFVTDIPENMEFSSLYNGDRRLDLTRYPEKGFLTVKDRDDSTALFTEENTPWEYTRGDFAFYTDTDMEFTSFYNTGDVRLKLMHYWFCERTLLTAFDGKKISFLTPASMLIRPGDRYFLENVFEMLKKPGQWYADSKLNKLYYIPKDGETAESLSLFAPLTPGILNIVNSENIAFNNITFERTDQTFSAPDEDNGRLGIYGMLFPQGNLECKGAAEVVDSSGISFINCDFLNIGNTGIRFTGTNKSCNVTGCMFKNIGCNSVFINGINTADKSKQTSDINVVDNLIDGYGRNFPSGIGILLTHAVNCKLRNNEIKDGYYTAISVGWVWGYSEQHTTDNIEICDNLIYDIGQGMLSDMGGIYTLGIQPHTVISGNVIHNVAADPGEGGYGGWGIYLDEGSSGILVEKNLVFDCGSQSFHQHYGKDNKIQNNIFALSKISQVKSTRKEEHNEFSLERNIILADDTPVWVDAQQKSFTDNRNLFWDLKNGRHIFGMFGNTGKKIDRMFKSTMEMYGWLDNAVYEDPMFRDPENGDFTLAENSPAFAEIGFESFNYNSAGTLSDFS